MKNSKLAKLVLVVLIGVMITCVGIDVFAADNSTYQDLGSVLNATGNNAAGGNNTTGGNNLTGNNTLNTSALTNNTANNAANNMTNTTLPKTGVANSTSVIVLITICGISAIYAYNKIKDYKNV